MYNLHSSHSCFWITFHSIKYPNSQYTQVNSDHHHQWLSFIQCFIHTLRFNNSLFHFKHETMKCFDFLHWIENWCGTRHHCSINADIPICIDNRVDEFFSCPGCYSIVVIFSSGLMNCAYSIRVYSLSMGVLSMLYKIFRNQTNIFAASK